MYCYLMLAPTLSFHTPATLWETPPSYMVYSGVEVQTVVLLQFISPLCSLCPVNEGLVEGPNLLQITAHAVDLSSFCEPQEGLADIIAFFFFAELPNEVVNVVWQQRSGLVR